MIIPYLINYQGRLIDASGTSAGGAFEQFPQFPQKTLDN